MDIKVVGLSYDILKDALSQAKEGRLHILAKMNESISSHRNKLSAYAKKEGVSLLIENNVISKKNLDLYKTNPLLMTNTNETRFVMNNTPKNINLLVDVAHLKVSAKTLKFDKKRFLQDCSKWIQGYHLSDNDGNYDSNEVVKRKSWFWPYLKKNINYYTLEVNSSNTKILLQQKKLIENMLN